MPVPRADVQIGNISADERVYIGANNETGQIKFQDNGSGWYLWDLRNRVYRQAGPRITLAMGLTECCAKLGRGKLFFFQKDFLTSWNIPYRHTEDFTQLPDLLYVDFVWDDRTKDEWFKMPQWQRLDALSARGNALHPAIPVMPITLAFDHDNYDQIRITEGVKGALSLYTNRSGFTYLGFTLDMSSCMKYYTTGQARGTPTAQRQGVRCFWQGDKPDVDQFRCTSGPDMAQRLHGLYSQKRDESLYLYKEIMSLAKIAHQNWTANGGYTIESDGDLGQRVAREAEAAIALQVLQSQGGGGTRLQQLRQIVASWDAFKQTAVRGYQAAARQGIVDVSLFMIEDQEWLNLTLEAKKLVVELYQLDEEADVLATYQPVEGGPAAESSELSEAEDQAEDSDEEL